MANVYQLKHAAQNHAVLKQRIAEAFGLAADDPAVLDTTDGESDLKELAAYALREAEMLDCDVKAIAERIDILKARQQRKKAAIEKLREAVALALHEAGERKLTLPDMTVSVTQRPKLLINEDELPDEFKREVVTYKVDREKLNAAIDAGQTIIPGVNYGNAAPSITVRVR